MNDYQIARNLGEMFENATKSLNMVFDTKNIALPPSVTSFINTNYYNIETTFTLKEIIKGLESNNDNEVYTVLKHLVGKLVTRYDNDDDDDGDDFSIDNNETIKEIVQLFPHIIKNVNSTNLKIKRLVYIILLSFNHLQQDISLLSINAIQKSLTDKSAINRSLAIRCLSGIRIPAILPILLLSMAKLVKDSSPLVRSACTIAIIKCTELDIQYNMINKKKNNTTITTTKKDYLINSLKDETSTIYQLNNYLDILLSDNDPKVLSCSIIAYYEIFNGCFDILHNKLNNLINHIEEMDSFAISNLIDIIIEYNRLFLPSFKSLENSPIELKNLYNHLINLIYYSMDYN
ncbi:AP-3 complex subunit beta, partial [Pichia californica]